MCLFDFQLLFLNTFQKVINGIVLLDDLHMLYQSCATRWHFVLKLISYFAIMFLFILMFTNNRFSYWAMAFYIDSVYLLSHMK